MTYTTVCVDIYGKVYDLRYEHPSWEAEKNGQDRCIVRDAFMWPVEELDKLKKREGKNKKNKRKA